MRNPHEPQMSGTKHCPGCDRDLHCLFFAACKTNRDGLRSKCRECLGREGGRKKSGETRTRKTQVKYPYGIY